jgi:hypothetical protein
MEVLKRRIWVAVFNLNSMNKVWKLIYIYIGEIHGWIYALLICGIEMIRYEMVF